MSLSYQFADSALVLQLLLLLLYIFSKHLPTYQNFCFRRLLEFSCYTTFLDIVTCTLDSSRAVTSLPLPEDEFLEFIRAHRDKNNKQGNKPGK